MYRAAVTGGPFVVKIEVSSFPRHPVQAMVWMSEIEFESFIAELKILHPSLEQSCGAT